LRNRIASTKPGTSVALTIVRDRREQSLSAKLGELASPARGASESDDRGTSRGAFGLQVEPLTREHARQLGVGAERGLVVGGVTPDSPAAKAGLRSGDVIETVDGKPVTSGEELRLALEATPERPALVLVHRKDQTLFLTLTRE
ncbi:MAG TPA: PDZ domain-containing protein, partial [Vicinamibacterales bacterium]|nr:PDZ domain-containing protein [Vicinamibacterales bacterium]